MDSNLTTPTDSNLDKKIIFTETTTKYQMKKIMPTVKERKKRVETHTWGLNESELSFETQLTLLNEIDLKTYTNDKYSKLIISHIKTKIQSYKQQDILKKIYDEQKFIHLEQVITLLQETKLKCHYCSCETYLLYELVREMKQWSLDRIDNNVGHNRDNLVMACLECNLKRRRTNKDSFMFTKNLKIVREGIDS
jgi:5-methylcytosine-specific restriction endonuclease McrA